MKKTLFTSMIIVVLLAGMVLTLPVVFAAPPTAIHIPSHQAEGTINGYHEDLMVPPPPVGTEWVPNPDTIIRGKWRVQVFYGVEVEFDARFSEENGEWGSLQIPGTIDTFKMSLLPGASFDDSSGTEWELSGTLEFRKKGWNPATGKPVFSTLTLDAVIIITPLEITIDLERGEPEPIPPWDIWGTTAFFDGQEYPPAFLEGNKINVYFMDLERPVDEPCFVMHGWMWDEWQSRSPTEQDQLLRCSSFQLWIDGKRIQMETLVHWHAEYTTSAGTFFDVVFVSYYVQFEVDHFTAGDYTFKGVWTAPNNPTHTNEITVTFT